jgi:hypothetical protein
VRRLRQRSAYGSHDGTMLNQAQPATPSARRSRPTAKAPKQALVRRVCLNRLNGDAGQARQTLQRRNFWTV